MAKQFISRPKSDETTGYGTNSKMFGDRLVKKDGRQNISRTGLTFFEKLSWYHTLIEMRTSKFILAILISFLFFNLLFAIGYYIIGVDHLIGMLANTKTQEFIEAYFFSAQTFTTVGYGRISPKGNFTSLLAAIEAFFGLLFFAIATGLFYARFSRPQAFIRFSEKAVFAPYKDGIAYMFRIVPYKNNKLTDAEIKVTVSMVINENGNDLIRFYPMELEISKINSLTLSWTIVHPVNDKSPMFNLTKEELIQRRTEVLVYLKAFDDTFSNTVVARSSYIAQELVVGAKFVPMYKRSPTGNTTILQIDKLNVTERVELPIFHQI